MIVNFEHLYILTIFIAVGLETDLDKTGNGMLNFMNNEQKLNESIYFKFWFTWLVVTAVYIILQLSEFYLAYWVGFFVPVGFIGFVETIITKSPEGFIGIFIVLLSVLFADKFISRLQIKSDIKRVVFNIIFLFVLTIIVEFIMFQEWAALTLLRAGDDFMSIFY
jgi:hypothetical protein